MDLINKIIDKANAYGTRYYWQGKRGVYKNVAKADIAPTFVANPILLRVPRNRNCVCGSGKKFKKCCLNDLSRQVTIGDANKLSERLSKHGL